MPGRKEIALGSTGRPISPLGVAVRELRTQRGLSVTDLAVKAGLGESGRGHVSKIEHGAIRRVSDDLLRALAHALNVSFSYLSGFTTSTRARVLDQPAQTQRARQRRNRQDDQQNERRDQQEKGTSQTSERWRGASKGSATANTAARRVNRTNGAARGMDAARRQGAVAMIVGGEPTQRDGARDGDSEADLGAPGERRRRVWVPRRIRDQRAGQLIRRFRLWRPRSATAQARPEARGHMTQAELAARYSEREKNITGQDRYLGETFVNKMEHGLVRLTEEHVAILAQALNLSDAARAVLEEAIGLPGFPCFLLEQLGISVPETLVTLPERVARGEVTEQEMEGIVEAGVRAIERELEERYRYDWIQVVRDYDWTQRVQDSASKAGQLKLTEDDEKWLTDLLVDLEPAAQSGQPSPAQRAALTQEWIKPETLRDEAAAEQVFDALWDAFKVDVFTFLVRMVRSEDEARPLLQEVFATVFDLLLEKETHLEQRAVCLLLFRIAAERSKQYLRGKTGERAQPQADRPVVLLDGDDVNQYSYLESGLGLLPDEERACLLLRFDMRLSVAEIAEILGMAPTAVRKQLAAGLQHLRTYLAHFLPDE